MGAVGAEDGGTLPMLRLDELLDELQVRVSEVRNFRMPPGPELAARVGAVLHGADSPVVLHCGGGMSAAATALALTLHGRDGIAVYDGSLEEWSKDPALPLELGGLSRSAGWDLPGPAQRTSSPTSAATCSTSMRKPS
ncbi:rhodanese-like domain-containing protein [Streptomyces sp. NPDC051172]|uniref:rhodanese-like domain-containing protein n=1 Tax=Streptomyces sp. NPDC051172 TaxID=3155796 RepID=UPI00341D535F